MAKLRPKSLNWFLKRTKRLAQLYDFSVHCYTEVAEELQRKLSSGELSDQSHVHSRHGFVLHHRVVNVIQHAQVSFPRDLRATILVRLVADFEVFLVDQIRDVARRAGIVFREDSNLDWPRAKLKSFATIDEVREELIEADCRNLTSAGFDEICKFYKKHLHTQVNPPSHKLEQMREIHARRHLHVHRGGIVDTKYVHDFGDATKVGSVLHVEDAYLHRSFELLRAAAKYVAEQCAVNFPAKKKDIVVGKAHAGQAEMNVYLVSGRFRDGGELKAYFDPSRTIANGAGHLEFGRFLAQAEIDGLRCEWTVIAPREILDAFFKDLARHTDQEIIRSVVWRRITPWAAA
jgi:hypothetical protein